MAYNRKQRLNDNIKAIETAFILDREQRTPTARERLLLERYCGFGGLKCILNPARELADAVHWAKSDLELFAPTVELHRLIRENSKNESEYKQLMDSLKQVRPYGILHAVCRYRGSDGCVERASDYPRKGS